MSTVQTILAATLASVTAIAQAAPATAPTIIPTTQSVIGRIQTLLSNPKTWEKIPKDVHLCIYSPEGARGKNFQQAISYMSETTKYTDMARDIGIDLKMTNVSPLNYRIDVGYPKVGKKASTNVNLKVYIDERVLAEDFKAKRCDGAGMSNIRARQFNKFAGSIDAIGAILSYKQMSEAISVLARPQFAPMMINNDYEIVGTIPIGAAYIMVNDRKINNLAKAAGRKVAVFDFDKTQAKLVQRVGAQPISVDLTSVAGKFNNGEVEIMGAPALLFEPFELHKGMTDKNGNVRGAIIRFPLMQLTASLVMQRNKFPDGLGQILREITSMQLMPAYQFIYETESDIPIKYWMDVPAADQPGYHKLMREARIDMTKEGHYDKRMMNVLKQVRCKFEPSNFECTMNDE